MLSFRSGYATIGNPCRIVPACGYILPTLIDEQFKPPRLTGSEIDFFKIFAPKALDPLRLVT